MSGIDPQDEARGSGPTLTHSQSVKRLEEVFARMEELGEADELSPEEDAEFAELRSEFTEVDEHRKVRTAREAAATKLGEVIRKAECPRDDEGFPVLRGRGVCEVVRVVTWSAAGSNTATAELRTTHRVSQSIQTCELAQERTLAAEPDGAVFATPRAMSELTAVP